MNSQNGQDFIGYHNEEIQRHQGMIDIKKKSENFRKEIRKEHLDKYFKAKRRLYFENPQKKTLIDCMEAIEANFKVIQNVCSLVNLLALKKPFDHYSSENLEITPKIVESFCTRTVDILLNKTIPSFEDDPKCRIYCINALSNLFADQLCPNVRFVEIVVEAIDARYGGLDVWDVDEEIIEVFYMISNLIRKNITHAKLLPIQKILSWAEAGIRQIPSDPLKCLTEGILQLFKNVDQMYNSNQNSLFTLHFSSNREIILQNFVQRFVKTDTKEKLKQKHNFYLDSQNIFWIFKLFNKNKQYLLKIFYEIEDDMEDKLLREKFVNNTIIIMSQENIKKDIINEIGNFLVNFLRFYPTQEEERQIDTPNYYYIEQGKEHLNTIIAKIHQHMFRKEYLERLLISLSHQNIDCKKVILKILMELLKSIPISFDLSKQQEISSFFRIIFVDKHLETILVQLVSEMDSRLNDIQMLETIISIYSLAINTGNGKFGVTLRQKLQNLLMGKSSWISKDLFEFIEVLVNSHKEKMIKQGI